MPSQRVLFELTRRYTEPERRYHDLAHVAALLLQGRALDLSEEQILGIWFHDAVYDIHSPTNEEDSARLAADLLGAEGYPATSLSIVEHIVLDTKNHLPTIEESKAVIDLDLASLGSPWKVYQQNTAKLHLECEELGEREIRARYQAFCESFLARKRIYWTRWGEAREAQARRNLHRALRFLKRV